MCDRGCENIDFSFSTACRQFTDGDTGCDSVISPFGMA